MFIFLVFHQHCKSRSGSLQNVLWKKHKQNRRQEVVNRGIYVCGGAWHSILTNFTNLVFHISICGGFAHQSPPVTTGLTTRRSNTFVIRPSGYEFSRFEKYWAAFFIPAWFVLPYITRAGCYRALPALKQTWHLKYQQCRLIDCSLYVTNLAPS